MAYKYEELEELSLKVIEEEEPPFISHLVAYLPCSSSTFYDLGLEKSETIKDALHKVKVEAKKKMLKWMQGSENATATIACYKLMSDPTELALLNSQQIDLTTKGKSFNTSDATTEELIKRAEASKLIEDES